MDLASAEERFVVQWRAEKKEEGIRGKELGERVGREGKREKWGSPQARED